MNNILKFAEKRKLSALFFKVAWKINSNNNNSQKENEIASLKARLGELQNSIGKSDDELRIRLEELQHVKICLFFNLFLISLNEIKSVLQIEITWWTKAKTRSW